MTSILLHVIFFNNLRAWFGAEPSCKNESDLPENVHAKTTYSKIHFHRKGFRCTYFETDEKVAAFCNSVIFFIKRSLQN